MAQSLGQMLEKPEGSRVGCWKSQEVQTSYRSDCKVCMLTERPLCLGIEVPLTRLMGCLRLDMCGYRLSTFVFRLNRSSS